jgi:hypothetical protein
MVREVSFTFAPCLVVGLCSDPIRLLMTLKVVASADAIDIM